MAKRKYYDSVTGDVVTDEQSAPVAVEHLRIPGVVERLMDEYIPAPDEQSATDVFGYAALRDELGAWNAFGAKDDALSEYLNQLNMYGYNMIPTTSGLALCLIRRNSPRVINQFDTVDTV